MADNSKKSKVVGVIVAVVVAVLVAFGVRFAITQFGGGDSTEAAVEKGVAEIKAQNTLPQQVDEVTTWEDVTAEDTAIHYLYTISGADTTQLTDADLKDSIAPTLCNTKETKDLLDQNVQMKYSYTVAETGDDLEFTVTKTDCA